MSSKRPHQKNRKANTSAGKESDTVPPKGSDMPGAGITLEADIESLRGILMQAPAMIAVCKGPEKVFEVANPLYLKAVGKSADIIGRPLLEALPELRGQDILNVLENVYATGKPYVGNEVLVRIDNDGDGIAEDMYFNFVYQPLKDSRNKVDGLMTHAVDVTEQVLLRKRITESEDRYRTLFDSIDEGFCIIEVIFDSAGHPVDYRFLEINQVFENQTGLKRAVGKTVKELVPDIETSWIERYGKVASTGKSVRFTEGSDVMGRWFDVHASRLGIGDMNRVALLFKDITKRKHAEMQQEKAIRQVTEVLESMGDAFFMLDKDWKIVRVNKIHEKVTKTKRKEIIGKHFWDVFPDTPDSKYWIEHHKVMETRKPSHFVERYAPLDLWTETDVYPTSGGGISVFFRDITARRKAEEALVQSEERFRTLIEKSTDAIQLVSPEGKILYSSDSLKNVLGYSAEELEGAGVFPFIHPEDIDYFNSRIAELVKNPKKQILMQYRVRHKDGSWAWIETTGVNHLENPNIQALVGTFRNVTKRKQDENAVRESEARLRFMAESMPQKVFTANADGTTDYYNPQWMEYTGLRFQEIQNWGWTQIIHPEDVDASVAAWNESIHTGKPFEMEQRFRGKDGKYHWHISRAHAMRDESGKVIKWIGSSTDIDSVKRALSRKKHLEEVNAALKEQRAQLITRNTAKDEFISLASHQLRTPATGVKQYLGMVLDGFAGDVSDDQRAMLEKAYDSNEREITIINDLLKVAQVDAGKVLLKKQKVNMARLVEEIVDGQRSKFTERHQTVTSHGLDKEIVASVDTDRIRMVLENIIDNASKYTPEGKSIEVRLEKNKDLLAVAVKDEGVGIEVKDLNKLFRKFSRLDNPLSVAVGGSGLGLYWAKKIIDLHDGSITVNSREGTGTVFTVVIPVS